MENLNCSLKVEQLSVWYKDKKIISNINLELYENSITAIVGPSGCGKSTFLYSIANLLQNNREAKQTGRYQLQKTNSKVGIVFQKALVFKLSIYENIALALKEQKWSASAIEQKVEQALIKSGLWDEVHDRLREPASSLSGGQQQRLCLARVLALEPSVLLLDEPCSSLDPIATKKIEETLKILAQSTSILIVTHNLQQAKRLADRLLVFWNHGNGAEIIEEGDCSNMFVSARTQIAQQYLNGYLG